MDDCVPYGGGEDFRFLSQGKSGRFGVAKEGSYIQAYLSEACRSVLSEINFMR